jgi:hypothetical protein
MFAFEGKADQQLQCKSLLSTQAWLRNISSWAAFSVPKKVRFLRAHIG